jgi:hypothetical protein
MQIIENVDEMAIHQRVLQFAQTVAFYVRGLKCAFCIALTLVSRPPNSPKSSIWRRVAAYLEKKFAPATVGSNAAVARGFCSPLILRAAAAIQSGVTNGQA